MNNILFLILLFVSLVFGYGEDDRVANLPGVTFQTNFKTYSGYLDAGNNGQWRMHYVLHESQNDPANDPLLLWFNGGPGCSSYADLLESLGPFFVNHDGQSLFENVYSWNKKANLLALESPMGVGFSYDTQEPLTIAASDNRTRDQNYNALKDFFLNAQPGYKNRTFFLSGESYAGVYIPMLSARIVQGIKEGDFPNPNFQGAAIGNGFMHVQKLWNSLVIWSAYHGRVSPGNWQKIKDNCATKGATHSDDYDYTQFMYTLNGMDYWGDNTTCGQLIAPLTAGAADDDDDFTFDAYNFYQDCYYEFSDSAQVEGAKNRRAKRRRRRTTRSSNAEFGGFTSLNQNTATLFNYDSTDNQLGYPCWNIDAATAYLNRKDVQAALHIEAGWSAKMANITWEECSDAMYDNYHITYPDQQQFFDYVIANIQTKGFRFLVYNGDTDTVCNYLGDTWFVEQVAAAHNVTGQEPLIPWNFAENLGGYYQRYDFKSLTIDMMTVKGAGHFVPLSRPGPALQMITNFMFPFSSGSEYSSEKNIKPKPVLSPLINGSTDPPTTTPKTAAISFPFLLVIFIVTKMFVQDPCL